MAREAGWLEVIPEQGRTVSTRAPRQPRGRRAVAPRDVEPAVRFARSDRERRVGRVEEHEVLGRHAGGREPLAAAARPGRAPREEEGHVGADRERDLREGATVPDPERAREDPQHRRRVGRAAAEPGRHGDALRDADRDAAVDAEPLAEERRRARRQVPVAPELRAPGDRAGDRARPPPDLDVHLVGEVERREEGEEVVVAVRAERADAQDEVHLGGCERREAHARRRTTPPRRRAALRASPLSSARRSWFRPRRRARAGATEVRRDAPIAAVLPTPRIVLAPE